uniref:Uncharacterized protein n=1 Tax=Panagrolaimus davidi TaxID=227884 RepID=A0A914Q2V0_9BILA
MPEVAQFKASQRLLKNDDKSLPQKSNPTTKMPPKAAKKGGKKPAAADEEDIDALLQQIEASEQKSKQKQAKKGNAKGGTTNGTAAKGEENGKADSANDYLKEIAAMKPIDEQFPDKNFPTGEIMEYLPGKDDRTAENRMTNEEKKALDNTFEDTYRDIRRAAESHRQTRKYVRSWIKPGMTMIDIW